MRTTNKKPFLAVSLMMLFATVASADTYSFVRVSGFGRGGENEDLSGQLFVDVTQNLSDSSLVDFRFYNDVGIPSSITDVYFDDGGLLGISSINSSAGVSFTNPATPGDLPSGNELDPAFETTANFSADSAPPVSANGVDADGEWVTITFSLQADQTYSDVINQINAGLGLEPGDDPTGTLRMGLHVQAIGVNGGSDSYVSDALVPVPGAAALGAIGLGVLGLRKGRKTRSAPARATLP